MKFRNLTPKAAVSILKLFMDRGKNYMSIVNTFMLLLLTIRSYQISDWVSVILLLILGMVWIVVGFVDYKWGYWKKQNELQTVMVNPFFRKLRKDVAIIKSKVENDTNR